MAGESGAGHSREVTFGRRDQNISEEVAGGGSGKKAAGWKGTRHVQGAKRRPWGWSMGSTGGGDTSDNRDVKGAYRLRRGEV